MAIINSSRLRPGKTLTLMEAPIAVPAGFPSPATDYYRGAIDLNQVLMTNPDSTFIVNVAGDSMTGAGIAHGDRLIVDRSPDPRHGDIIVADLDSQLTIKRLVLEHGHAVLQSENPDYPNIIVHELSELRVWGVVTWCLKRV